MEGGRKQGACEHVTESVHVRKSDGHVGWVIGGQAGMHACGLRWGTTASSEHHCQAHALQA